jgi:exodeoxyribonuclease VII small subunit
MAKRAVKPEKLGFEDAIQQLEDLIDQIESGDIGLEESLKRYEQGSALIKRCRAILDGAQEKIAELTAGPDGGLTVDDTENQGETGEDADE